MINYLKTLDATDLYFVIQNIGGVHTDSNGGCVPPRPSSHPTPNGDWVCSGNKWVWIPDIG